MCSWLRRRRRAAGIQYQYQVFEADATLGLISNSDFGGGTDGEGHRFLASGAIDKKWQVAATYFDNTHGVDLGSVAHCQRRQLVTMYKY